LRFDSYIIAWTSKTAVIYPDRQWNQITNRHPIWKWSTEWCKGVICYYPKYTRFNLPFNYQPKGSDPGTQYYWLSYWATSPSRFGEGHLAKRPSHTCVETYVSLVKVSMVYGRITMMMMTQRKKDDDTQLLGLSSFVKH